MIYKTPQITANELEVIEQITKIRTKLGNSIRNPQRWIGYLRRNLTAKAIQGSNTIEGYNVTFEEAVALVEEEDIDVNTETRLALRGYREALTYIIRLADDPYFTINEELVRSLHYMMISYAPTKHPGQWRTGPIFVRREPSGERVYEGPDAELVPVLMNELVRDIQNPPGSTPVMVRAAMAHLNLVMIHPFSDGNGRMGRALQTLVLTQEGILPPMFSSIEEYLGSRGNTDDYYEVLYDVGQGNWNPQHNAIKWVHFCLKAHLQQAVTIERRIREIARIFDDLEAEIKRRNLNPRTIFALYEAAIGLRVRSDRYRAAADISAQVASNDLRKLVAEGLLVAKGEKRGRSYLASGILVKLRDTAREPKKALPENIFDGQLRLL